MTTATIGALGSAWRGDVTPAGTVVPWDGSAPLDWAIAADDRWHRPAAEVAVRQQRVAGTPVLETRVKIPGGDALHRVWVVADAGGATVVEITNESPLPIAVAFTRGDLLTARVPTDLPIEGIDLPAESIVLPVGHRSTITVALAHDGRTGTVDPSRWSTADAVVRGWLMMTERASRLVLPDERLAEAVTAARSEALLGGVAEASTPVERLLVFAELARMDQLPRGDDVVLDLAEATEATLRTPADWRSDVALEGAARVLTELGEQRAVRDVQRAVARRPQSVAPSDPADLPTGIATVAAVERLLLANGRLFPAGIPAAWRGQPIEAHGLAAGPASTLSFGVRWHGANPAVLWEVTGEPVALSAPAVDPAWTSTSATGEALWRVDGVDARAGASPATDASTSFS